MKPSSTTDESTSAAKQELGRSQVTWLLALGTVPLLALLYFIFAGRAIAPTAPFVALALLIVSLLGWFGGTTFARRRWQARLSLVYDALRGAPTTTAELSRLRGDIGDL